jgi:hypothetical protein
VNVPARDYLDCIIWPILLIPRLVTGSPRYRLTNNQGPPLLAVVVHDLAASPALTGLCAGFELGRWRADALADHLLEALPEFCLTYSELEKLNHETAVALLRQAAGRVYTTKKFKRRGEFGELLLHVVLKQVMGTVPAVSKIFYKDAANDTVKGFDAVHVIATASSLELWLGEVKFYKNVDAAIRDVVKELKEHTNRDYLRGEFYAIKNKIDAEWPHADKLRRLLHQNVSLDEVFHATCIPVLLTYDGDVTQSHTVYCQQYVNALATELRAIHARFAAKALPKTKIHLFLVPLATKKALMRSLDRKLKSWQRI